MTAAPTVTQTTASVTLSWPALSSTWTSTTSVVGTGNDNVYYKLEMQLSGASTWTELTSEAFDNSLSKVITMPDARLAYGSAYIFRVTPKNSCGLSTTTQPSSTAYTIKSSAPTFMNTPTQTTAYGNTITVSWTSITDDVSMGYRPITSYQLYYTLSTPVSWVLLVDSNVNTYSQTNPASATQGFQWSKTYLYKVKAVNAVGAGTDSGQLSVNTPTVPGTMTSLQCTSIALSGIKFTWNAMTTDAETGRHPITHYYLRFRVSTSVNDLDWQPAGTGTSGFTALTVTHTSGWSTGTLYSYQIRAENVPGAGPWSASINVQTPKVPNKMAIPTCPASAITPT